VSKYTKPYAQESATIQHRYDIIEPTQEHFPFYNFIKIVNDFVGYKQISIIDICGGNGRVIIPLLEYIKNVKYESFDFNVTTLNTGINYFKYNSNIKFTLCDIDTEFLKINIKNKYNIALLDSSLQMLENPERILKHLCKNVDFVFLNRTPMKDRTFKGQYKWGGCDEPSTMWDFDRQFFDKFCSENGYNFYLYDKKSCYIRTKSK